MSTALKILAIGYLRGSVVPFTLPFEKGKKLTVIYGENASGKTTICDAFEFLGHGSVGSLEDRGLGSTGRYWPSLGRAMSDVMVSLEAGDTTFTASIKKGKVVVAPPEGRPRIEILRRSQLQRLVEAAPAERYAEIRRFIDVRSVETSEKCLRDLIKDIDRSRETAIAAVQENETTIQQFWESAGRPTNDAIKWASQHSTQDVSALADQQKAIGKLRTAYQRVADHPAKIEVADKMLEKARASASAAQKNLEGLVASAVEGVEELVSILDAADSYLELEPKPQLCPLCESKEKIDGLKERVAARLKGFSALQQAKQRKEAADNNVALAQSRLTDLTEALISDSQVFESVKSTHQWPTSLRLPKQPCPKDRTALLGWIEATSELANEWVEVQTKAQVESQFIGTLKKAFNTYTANVRAQKELDQLVPRLEKTLEIVADERRTFTDGALRAIAKKVGALYETVHPGEGIDRINLALDEEKRASLDIGTSFGDQASVPPQAYLSQSHLDTLGLCIFLALASLDEPAGTTLVLDDILASVDEPHVERLIEMLYGEVLKFRHCIMTTHYRPWKEKLRWGWLQNGQCQFVELGNWTLDEGLKLQRSVPDVERLRTLLAETPPDLQLICAKAGVILEAGLDFLTLLYECRVPRRVDQRHTLRDLLDAVNKKLRGSLRVEVASSTESQSGVPVYTTVALGPILDELERIAQARNVFGAHFNQLSFALMESDAIGFGQHVLALMDVLTCSDAGWPRSKSSGGYWATAGETRRLHPLQQPT